MEQKEFNIKLNLSYNDELNYNRVVQSGIHFEINDSPISNSLLTPEEREKLKPLHEQNSLLYTMAHEIKDTRLDIQLLQSYINSLNVRINNLEQIYNEKEESTLKLANDIINDIAINNKKYYTWKVYK